MEKKLFKFFEPGVRLLLLALITIVALSAFYNKYIFAMGVGVFCFVYFYYVRASKQRKNDVVKYIENLSYNVDSLSKKSVLNFPIPMILVRLNEEISWYNQKFSEILEVTGENLFEKKFSQVFGNVNLEKLIKTGFQEEVRVEYEGRNFVLQGSPVEETEKGEVSLIAFYLIEETETVAAKKQIDDHQSVVAVVMIDNYEEVILQANDVEKASIIANIDKQVSLWATKYEAVLQRFQRDRYLMIMEMPFYRQLMKDKYSILDSIKEIVVGESKIPVTLSIGIGKDTYSFIQKFEHAKAGIEIALGRGGDQVVVKSNELYEYYGGKSKELEKRTRVKSRVMATALKELIKGSDNIYIMGHRFSDLDALGAAVGIYRIAKNFGKDPKIILDSRSQTITRVVDCLLESAEYEDVFLPVTGNLPIITDKTLLVVVDTHSSKYVEWEELLGACSRIVVIDHHRRGEFFIENATLMFHEAYASSTSEMVTEVAGYLDKEGKLTKNEANALMGGIILDTKGFTLKTGVRTFEAASALKRLGADPVEAKRFFQNSLEEYKRKMAFIATAEFFDNMAICVSENEGGTLSIELFAQGIDELMSVEGIDASFGLARFGNAVHVSARSYGKVNVQAIIERLGGGGHQTMAGVQLKEKTVGQVKAMLINAIYYEENIDDIREEMKNESNLTSRRKG